MVNTTRGDWRFILRSSLKHGEHTSTSERVTTGNGTGWKRGILYKRNWERWEEGGKGKQRCAVLKKARGAVQWSGNFHIVAQLQRSGKKTTTTTKQKNTSLSSSHSHTAHRKFNAVKQQHDKSSKCSQLYGLTSYIKQSLETSIHL